MAAVNIQIIAVSAYLTEVGADQPRPFFRGSTANVDRAVADRMVADGLALYTDSVSAPAGESETEDDPRDLATLRRVAADLGIEGMDRANRKTVLAALREQESAGESETRIGSGDRR